MAVSLTIPQTTSPDAKSSHVSESNVQPFLQADFDPADYLNATLPSLSATASTRNAQTALSSRSVSLAELSTQLQTQLTQLNAQTSRLSNALTQLTDEIIRSGGRLAYEVDVLRGETSGLTDSLENGLKRDIELFTGSTSVKGNGVVEDVGQEDGDAKAAGEESAEPEYLARLRTLTSVRSRLDSVIKVFGEAMQWPIAPSDVSMASSLISVSAPDAGDDARSREEKGKVYAMKLRDEIHDLLGSGNDPSSLEAAKARIDELKHLTEVWKGTAEEKARLKLVESLAKPVEERQRALEKASQNRRPNLAPGRGQDYRYGNMDSSRAGDGGYGFLDNLRNLKNDVYLE